MEATIKEKLKYLPGKPGVYIFKDKRGDAIYIGKASSLRSRVRSYFQKVQGLHPKIAILVSKIHDMDWIVTESEIEALMLECNLIKKHRPHYNVLLRDDKHYPYLCITTSEPFPRAIIVRRVKQDGNRYFGPYANSTAMRESLRLIRKIFHIRGCNKKLTGTESDRPCLNFHMGQCDSPCSGRIDREEYAILVRNACLFLEGRHDSLIEILEFQMNQAAQELQFERAGRLRDQIESVKGISARQSAISTDLLDRDVACIHMTGNTACVQLLSIRSGRLVGRDSFFLEGTAGETPETAMDEFLKQYYRDSTFIPKEIVVSHEPEDALILAEWLSQKCGRKIKLTQPKRGEKRRLVELGLENARLAAESRKNLEMENKERALENLEALTKALGMETPPKRIEAYDISDIQGTNAVGSMVVFQEGLPVKSQYRRFKVRIPAKPDDYAMMREVLGRRFTSARNGNPRFAVLPDLILIDGGRGQLNAALEAMSGLDYQIPVISLAKRLEEIHFSYRDKPLLLPRDSRALRLLQRIRDEAHRFALAYHHTLREKTARKSLLDSIPGVGESRRKALIRRFGSVAGVKRATLDELSAVPGISKPVAQAVYDALHSSD